ncbi:MAG: hypothetical protein F4103_12080 [Boseongicola sp. SB0673_bin_14]|nr:hypothetical protein [Boseongicola sp. SB0673_bin_14]
MIDQFRRGGEQVTRDWKLDNLSFFWNLQDLDVVGQLAAMEPLHAASWALPSNVFRPNCRPQGLPHQRAGSSLCL